MPMNCEIVKYRGGGGNCVNCLRWEGEHWHERARCSLLLIHTARLSTCEKFHVRLILEQKELKACK